MRSTYSRIWIACGLVIGFGSIFLFDSPAAAQSAVLDKATKTSGPPSALPAGDPATPVPQPPAISSVRSSVSLSPAVAVVNCKLGQSKTQTLTLTNRTDQELAFEMMAVDVVVRDGKRVFVPAGETPEGIATTAVFTQKEVVVQPQQSSSVGVTFTVPPKTPLRAAVAMFRGSTRLSGKGAVRMTASLGTLFTFTASHNFGVETAPLVVTAQSATANLGFSQFLTNTGSEPVVVDGVAVLLNDAGAIVGKATFEPQRLLPGERLPFQTEYSAELKSGPYRVLASFRYEGRVVTSSGDFTVP